MADLAHIQQKIVAFREERDWVQFHDPKNLAEALTIDAGELLENFLWKATEQSRNLSPEELKNVKEELADIFISLIIEVTGEHKKDKVAKVSTANTLWIPAINNHGGFGRWAFIEISDPWNAKNEIRSFLSGVQLK